VRYPKYPYIKYIGTWVQGDKGIIGNDPTSEGLQ